MIPESDSLYTDASESSDDMSPGIMRVLATIKLITFKVITLQDVFLLLCCAGTFVCSSAVESSARGDDADHIWFLFFKKDSLFQ